MVQPPHSFFGSEVDVCEKETLAGRLPLSREACHDHNPQPCPLPISPR